ncbi:hypothetical protein CC79DRAFT_1318614 [Sarocladium strictum]
MASNSYSTFAAPSSVSSTTPTLHSETMGSPILSRSPHLTRFLSDFTLGFSDGLTVPFALTAGLSSLGSTNTVIYAGLAELVAGSISMGIGGYLAAVDELPCPPPEEEKKRVFEEDEEDETRAMLGRTASEDTIVDMKGSYEEVVRRHLEPLALGEDITGTIIANLAIQPGGLSRTALRLQHHESSLSSSNEPLPVSPYASGLSISLGYVIGGIIPLLPYFFTPNVGQGLLWSIGLCLIALLFFGAGKSWVLRREGGSTWKRCAFEGVQMMVLGGCAAGSAILCVWLLDSGKD